MAMADDPGDPLPEVRSVSVGDLAAALRAGLADFRAAPGYGLFFAAVYVIAGLVLIHLQAGLMTWTLAITLGFPLVAPFLAVGLYEVSRRLETGEPLSRAGVLGVVWGERNRQIPWAGAVIVIYFLFWMFLAHMLFALFLGPSALLGPPETLSSYATGRGLALLIVGTGIGAVLAFLLFSLTAVSLPLLLDREVDFVSAMRLSLRVVSENRRVMVIWAATIASLTLLASVPWFLGLLVVMPVLGHASWHLYRRALSS